MVSVIDELKNEILHLNDKIIILEKEKQDLINENKSLKNENTYLQSYTNRISLIIRQNTNISDEDYRELRRSRHSK